MTSDGFAALCFLGSGVGLVFLAGYSVGWMSGFAIAKETYWDRPRR